MGDVTIILNNTATGGGGNRDDEDGWNEMSGSGDGESTLTSYQSTRLPVRPSKSPTGAGKDKGSEGNETMILYIISASIVFVAVVIIVVIAVICCRRRARKRRERQKAQLSNQGNEMVPKRETRVFGDIAGGDSKDPQHLENERILSRLLEPPYTVAPPPPTSSKPRVAPEAEKLLKASNNAAEASNHYEEIDSFSKIAKDNEDSSIDNTDDYLKPKSGSHGNKIAKNDYHDNKAGVQIFPVAKPRKNIGNVGENGDGYQEVMELGSAV